MAKNIFGPRKKKSDRQSLSPKDGHKTSPSVVFLTKAITVYMVMAAVGLLVMRYGHRNLERVLAWPPFVKDTNELNELRSAGWTVTGQSMLDSAGPESSVPGWMGQAAHWPILDGLASSLDALLPSLERYHADMVAVFCSLLCAFLAGAVMISLAAICEDFLNALPGDLEHRDFERGHSDSSGGEARDFSGDRSGGSSPKALSRREQHQNFGSQDFAENREKISDSLDKSLQGLVGGLSRLQVAFLALLTACGEEILFRGCLQPYLGIFGAGALYGLLHLGPGGISNPQNFLGFLRGFFLGWIFHATQDLWICIMAEFLFNLYTLFQSRQQVLGQGTLPLAPQTKPRDL